MAQISTDLRYHENPQRHCITLDRTSPAPTNYVEGGHFRIGNLYSFGISVAIEFAADQKTFFVVVTAISGITT
jgi:hypothetical protein